MIPYKRCITINLNVQISSPHTDPRSKLNSIARGGPRSIGPLKLPWLTGTSTSLTVDPLTRGKGRRRLPHVRDDGGFRGGTAVCGVSVCQVWRGCRHEPFGIVVYFNGVLCLCLFAEWCGFSLVRYCMCTAGWELVRAICSLYVRWRDNHLWFDIQVGSR